MLQLLHLLTEREGGGGAPLVCAGADVCCTREREPETDPQGHAYIMFLQGWICFESRFY